MTDPPTAAALTAAELFVRHAGSDDIAAHFEDRSVTFRELAREARRRAALWDSLHDSARPPHIIAPAAIVGINATYRGAELARPGCVARRGPHPIRGGVPRAARLCARCIPTTSPAWRRSCAE